MNDIYVVPARDLERDHLLGAQDNVFCMQSWVAKKYNVDSKDFSKQFEVPVDFDYIELTDTK